MMKERDLDPDCGDRDDCKYWSSSGVGKADLVPVMCYLGACGSLDRLGHRCPSGDCVRDYYLAGRSSATTVATKPSGIGYERIESTEFAKPHFNNCTHEKLIGHNYAYLTVMVNPLTPTNFYYSLYRRKNSVGSVAALGHLEPEQWISFDSAQRNAWWSMQPRYESEVQMLNFIYELKDFKRIAKYLLKFEFADLGRRLRSLRSKLISIDKKLSWSMKTGGSLRDLTRTTAEARLVQEYAIKPLIADISSIMHTLAFTIQAAQEQFALRGQASQLSHYSEDLTPVTTGVYGSNNDSIFFYGNSSECRFTATLMYKYAYCMRKGWDLFKRGMGLEFNAEVLWNAIPFTFLVDYFYEVGKALSRMRTDPNVDLHIHQYCESIMQYKTSGVLLDTSSPKLRNYYVPSSPLQDNVMIPIAGYTATNFRRRLTLPNKGTSLPRPHHPTKGQLWNMLALFRCFFD